MEVFRVSNYEEIKQITDEYRCGMGDAVLFRGTSDPNLVPSIAKPFLQSNVADVAVIESLLFEEFKKYYHHISCFTEETAIEWEIRIAAREFGLASSLMDWTFDLDIAIEFAINEFLEKNINYTSLWVLKKPGLNQITINSTPELIAFSMISETTVVHLSKYSESTHWQRKFIQGGYFLKQPNQNILTSLDKNPNIESRLIQIIIPQNIVGNIWKIMATKRDLDLPVIPIKSQSDITLGKICDALNKKYLK